MTESSFPFDNQDSNESQWSTLFSKLADTGVLGASGSTDLQPYADASGMFVKVPPGYAILQGVVYRNDSVLTLPVSASTSSARTDSVILKLDPGANTIVASVKVGSNTAPSLTQSDFGVYELKLADVAVAASATTIPSTAVTDRRSFSSTPWGKWTTATRPSAPVRGKAGFNFSTNSPEFYDGSSWVSFASTTTDASKLTSGTLSTARLDYGVMAAFRNERSVDAPVSADVVNGDWNNVLQPGVYRTQQGFTNTNAPSGANLNGTLVLFGAGSTVSSRTQSYFAQDGGHWWRTAWNGNDWGSWRSATANVGTSTSSVQFYDGWSRAGNNAESRVAKTGLAVTLTFQCTSPGSSVGQRLLKVPDDFQPFTTADVVAWTSDGNTYIGLAMDTDGFLRLRSGGIGSGGSVYGSTTYTGK